MTRRELLRTVWLGGAAALLGRGRLLGQGSQRPDSGDRLYDPSMVQQRSAATAADNDAALKSDLG